MLAGVAAGDLPVRCGPQDVERPGATDAGIDLLHRLGAGQRSAVQTDHGCVAVEGHRQGIGVGAAVGGQGGAGVIIARCAHPGHGGGIAGEQDTRIGAPANAGGRSHTCRELNRIGAAKKSRRWIKGDPRHQAVNGDDEGVTGFTAVVSTFS